MSPLRLSCTKTEVSILGTPSCAEIAWPGDSQLPWDTALCGQAPVPGDRPVSNHVRLEASSRAFTGAHSPSHELDPEPEAPAQAAHRCLPPGAGRQVSAVASRCAGGRLLYPYDIIYHR